MLLMVDGEILKRKAKTFWGTPSAWSCTSCRTADSVNFERFGVGFVFHKSKARGHGRDETITQEL
jgi:hypothetical protein